MWKILVAGAASVVLAGGCSAEDEPGDASAQLACQHFHNVAVDASEGVLTDAELRDKLKEVDSDASVSEDANVRRAARDMLAAITSGTDAEFESAVGRMSSACDPYRGG